MTNSIDPVFARALRSTLLDQVAADQLPAPRRYRRATWIGIGGVLALGVAGTAAAAMLGWPGAEVETALAPPVSAKSSGNDVLDIGSAPEGANAIHFEFACLSPGTYAISDGGIAITCDASEPAGAQAVGLIGLSAVVNGTLGVSADGDGNWQLRAWYVETTRIPLATNEHGETYGVDSDDAHPDLIQVTATNGHLGYVRRSEIAAAEGPLPTSPTQAANQKPETFDVPVYENDGVTVVGTFTWSD